MRLSQLMLPDIEAAFAADPDAVRELFEDLHDEDVADIVESAPASLAPELLAALSPPQAAGVLECIEPKRQVDLVQRLGVDRAAAIIDEMASDDRADFIAELNHDFAEQLLFAMDDANEAEVRSLVQWPEGTVGSVMSTEALKVPVEMSVGQVIERVRTVGQQAETVYYVFVVAGGDKLVGVVSLRDLILCRANEAVAAIMTEDVKFIGPDADREEAADLIQHYDLLALPVVDEQHGLLGLVTIDDLVDVIEEEATEDMHLMAAVQPLDDSYFGTEFWTFVRKRAPWLVALFIGGQFTANAMSWYDDVLQKASVLVLFLPLVISSGGNSGSQSATIIIRALAVGEVSIVQAGRVLARELAMGLVLGGLLATIGVVRSIVGAEGALVAMTLGLTLVTVVTLGTVVGAMLPILLERLGLDPAVSSTPFIASLVDLMGIVAYFSVARAMLL